MQPTPSYDFPQQTEPLQTPLSHPLLVVQAPPSSLAAAASVGHFPPFKVCPTAQALQLPEAAAHAVHASPRSLLPQQIEPLQTPLSQSPSAWQGMPSRLAAAASLRHA